MSRRVVVTGMGMVTPLGRDAESTWASLREARSGVGPITLFDASTFPTKIAAEVKGFDLASYIGDNAKRWSEHSRNTVFAIAAASMAYDESGLADLASLDPARFGVYLGSGEGQQDFPGSSSLSTDRAKAATRSTPPTSPARGPGACTRSRSRSRSPARPPGTSRRSSGRAATTPTA